MCGFKTGSMEEIYELCLLVSSVVANTTTTTYPKKMSSVDASKDSKCYATVNFGFGQASKPKC